MKRVYYGNGFVSVENGEIFYNNAKIESPPTMCNKISFINDRLFIDGYEYKNGKWKRSLRAIYHMFF